jgi:hypothetical protein
LASRLELGWWERGGEQILHWKHNRLQPRPSTRRLTPTDAVPPSHLQLCLWQADRVGEVAGLGGGGDPQKGVGAIKGREGLVLEALDAGGWVGWGRLGSVGRRLGGGWGRRARASVSWWRDVVCGLVEGGRSWYPSVHPRNHGLTRPAGGRDPAQFRRPPWAGSTRLQTWGRGEVA